MRKRSAAAATLARLVLVDRGGVVEGLRDRVSLGINAAEEFDSPLGALQQFVGLPQQLDPLFVPFERLIQPNVPLFERVNDLLEPFERILKAKLTGSPIGRSGFRH